MKELYHGSLEIVREPEIRHSNRKLDYGRGFYVTTDEQQARDWIMRKMEIMHADRGYLNVYEFDDEAAASELTTLSFNGPTAEWAEFVLKNRRTENFEHEYDLVFGPVADDNVYRQFILFESGLFGVDTLIQLLEPEKLVDQYLFHTPRSLNVLRFKNVEEINI